jgi:hypothetical protein
MRPIERIDNFLNKVDIPLLSLRWNINDGLLLDILGWDNSDIFKPYWKENPDQRIGQVLINLELVPDNMFIWNDEESDILKDQGIAPEEYLYWGSIYDKYMNRISLTHKLIKDLDSEHISAIYQYMFKNGKELSQDYRTAFKNVLLKRGELSRIEVNKLIEDFWDLPKITEPEFELEEKALDDEIKFEQYTK